ncbi:MAG: VWA domain-containing protein, partial [Clostridia bacterium]|nr:VWA domain-containing protein [Clostridia bacterium]
MISINFDNPWWFLLIVPIVAIVIVPFVFAVRKDNRNGHNTASLILHLVLAVMIGFTAAGTGVEVIATETDVYVVADVSYSARNQLDVVDEYIARLGKNLPRNSKLGVICFGKDYELLTPLGGRVKSVKNSIVNKSETNASQAMEYAGSLFRDGVIKRIVLITDGGETDKRDANALKRTADGLRADNIKIDAIWLDDNLTESDREVQISGVEFTQYTYRGHDESARVDIQSSYAGTVPVTVTLLKDGETASRRAESLSAGNNTVIFALDTAEAGSTNYEVRVETVETTDDDCRFNNVYQFTQTVSDALNVLLLTESAADRAEVEALYAGEDRVKLDSYFITDSAAPYSVEDLCGYDEIVISNADIGKHPRFALFVESLDTVVSLFGKSLVTIGDLSIQTRTDAALKQLEDMLPVQFGNNDRDPKLYTVVLDMSRSMETEGRLSRARASAEQLIKLLNDEDEIAVVYFYGSSEILQSPIKAKFRDEVIEKLYALDVVQGTFIGSGLRQAYDLMRDAPYREKQVMLISDGLNYTDENSLDPVGIVQDMRNAGIQ